MAPAAYNQKRRSDAEPDALRPPLPRAGAAATGLFLAALALSAATVPLVEPTTASTAQASLER